jgi:hypothetical protein
MMDGEEQIQIALGTVGWDEEDEDPDQGSDTNGGVTLVPVQLFGGRDHAKVATQLESGRAQGRRIWAQVGGPIYSIPSKGTRVAVGIPGGHPTTAGAAFIIRELGPSPTSDFGTDKIKGVSAGHEFVFAVGGTKIHIKDGQVLVGDDTAAALAHSAQVLAIISATQTLHTAFTTWLTNTISGGTFADNGPPLNKETTTLLTALTTWQTAVGLQTGALPTTKAKGT